MSEEMLDAVTTGEEITTEATEQVETGDTAQVEQETTEETPQERQERLFKQEEVDRMTEVLKSTVMQYDEA